MRLLIFLFLCIQLWIIVEPKIIEITIDDSCRTRRKCSRSCWRNNCERGYKEKYYVSDFKTSWHGAREYCEDRMGMRLLDARDRILGESVIKAIKKSGNSHCKKFWTDEKMYSSWMRRTICQYIDHWSTRQEFSEGSCEKKKNFICEEN